MSEFINGRYYDNKNISVYGSNRQLVLKFRKHTYEWMGQPKYVRFYTKGNKIGIETFNNRPKEPYNTVSEENYTVSLSWFTGTKAKTIPKSVCELVWNDSGLYVFEPPTEPISISHTHNRFSESMGKREME